MVHHHQNPLVQLTHGFPRSSILGHFLSLLYINAVPQPSSFSQRLILFADDTNIIICHLVIKLVLLFIILIVTTFKITFIMSLPA
jgi:hypothetical protein